MSDSTSLCVFYSPKDDATRTSPFLKHVKVVGSHLEAPLPSFVNANRILWAITLICEHEGVLLPKWWRDIEKNYMYFGHFNDGACADERQLLFWLVKPCPPVRQIFHPHSISAAWPRVSWALYKLVYSKFHRNVDPCACNWYQAAPSAAWVQG